jgi:hypothetical protein
MLVLEGYKQAHRGGLINDQEYGQLRRGAIADQLEDSNGECRP